MGITLSCASEEEFYDACDSFEALLVRSISFNENVNSSLRSSISFNGRDIKPAIFKAFGSGKLYIEGSLSFNGRVDINDPNFHLETRISFKAQEDQGSPKLSDDLQQQQQQKKNKKNKPILHVQTSFDDFQKETLFDLNTPNHERKASFSLYSPDHEAAVKLQKVYRSFRTRRRLADCAVLVEQHWWKLLDFALLKRNSVSFFDIEKSESVVSKWSRARTKAAKVGKGLSKDEKAQKLALQHWLEAIDPRHRYGHNLSYYYANWLQSESNQPFFYWLDVGDGKEVNLKECCPRSKLQQQCIKYLGPKEREEYEVLVEDGKFMYKQSKNLLDTTGGPENAKWIFVLSTAKVLYVGLKIKGTFQHSSFLAGGATSSAGRLVVEDGVLKAVWPHSGHYRPTEENFREFMSFLLVKNVDLANVQTFSSEEDAEASSKLMSSQCDEQNFLESNGLVREEVELHHQNMNTTPATDHQISSPLDKNSPSNRSINITTAAATSAADHSRLTLIINKEEEKEEQKDSKNTTDQKGSSDAAATQRSCLFDLERNLCHEDQTEEGDNDQMEEGLVPPELILRRINSKKGLTSYQLGKQMTFKWSTGAGPRIGCVRDYPSGLQIRALEQVQLSPRARGGGADDHQAYFRLSSPRTPTGGHTPRPHTPQASSSPDTLPTSRYVETCN